MASDAIRGCAVHGVRRAEDGREVRGPSHAIAILVGDRPSPLLLEGRFVILELSQIRVFLWILGLGPQGSESRGEWVTVGGKQCPQVSIQRAWAKGTLAFRLEQQWPLWGF